MVSRLSLRNSWLEFVYVYFSIFSRSCGVGEKSFKNIWHAKSGRIVISNCTSGDISCADTSRRSRRDGETTQVMLDKIFRISFFPTQRYGNIWINSTWPGEELRKQPQSTHCGKPREVYEQMEALEQSQSDELLFITRRFNWKKKTFSKNYLLELYKEKNKMRKIC